MSEIEDLEFNNSIARAVLDDQARERFEARARGLKFLSFTEEKAKEEQEKLFNDQVKWAFGKAVDYIRTNGFLSGPVYDDLEFFNSIMIQELEKTPSFNRVVRVSTIKGHYNGMVSVTVEGFDGKNKLVKSIEFDSRIFEPLPLPSNFDPPEKTTIDEDMMNFLIGD